MLSVEDIMRLSSSKSKLLIWYFLAISLLLPLAWSSPVHADFGPKPSITIVVKNPPAETYYLDLLIPEEKVNNSLADERDQYDPVKFGLLENYRDGEWVPALVHGTQIPLFGKLTGSRQGANIVHTFSYFGTPERFKIIIVTPDNQVVTSGELVRKTFQMTLTYDYQTGTVSQQSIVVVYLVQFLSTLIPTLIIEGLLLLVFGFSLRLSWRPFLLINLVTQVLLTAALGTAAITQGLFAAYLLAVPVEAVIIIAEAIAYTRLLKQHGKGRRIAYAIVANSISLVAGLVAMTMSNGL